MITSWHAIGTLHPTALLESKAQLHYAVQLIAAVGAALAEPLPDESHTSLTWNSRLKMFVGSVVYTAHPFQVGLNPVTLTLVLFNKQSEVLASLPLSGQSMATGLDWLKQEIAKLGVDVDPVVPLIYPPGELPEHPLAQGAAFDAPQEAALQELAHYYENAYLLLQEITTIEESTAVRIWPHHLDIATLIMIPGTRDGSPLTVGVGLSPGDVSYPEPYWYVSPYPYPNPTQLPALKGQGFWHTQHWVGGVLLASQLIQSLDGNTQVQQVEVFLQSAIQESIALLTSAPASV